MKEGMTDLEKKLLEACRVANARLGVIANLLTGHLSPKDRYEAYKLTYCEELLNAIEEAEQLNHKEVKP